MRTVTKQVYYCDFCGRYRLRRDALEMHERHCTANPERVCRWDADWRTEPWTPHSVERSVPDCIVLLAAIEPGQITEADIKWLRDDLGGCPACMLTALRCSGHDKGAPFTYGAEVARRDHERREEEQEQDWRDIESTFL